MLKSLLCCTTLLAIAIAGPVSAQDSVPEPATQAQATEQHDIKVPGTDYRIVLGRTELRPPAGSSRQDLLSAIGTWLTVEFDLAAVHSHPQIELVPAAKIVALRYKGILPNAQTNFWPNDRGATSAEHDTVAVYSDAARTIYLPEGWTGSTPAELSVLVHEMVHHAQNLLGLKHECPQEREKLAYLAQDRWLGLFGRSLESDFELDPMTLLIRTKCLH
jgi:hypothetical protein